MSFFKEVLLAPLVAFPVGLLLLFLLIVSGAMDCAATETIKAMVGVVCGLVGVLAGLCVKLWVVTRK